MRMIVAAAAALIFMGPVYASAATILGTGTGALVGGDLTDPEDNGNEGTGTGFNASFFASEEPGFGGGENAFNVFDNQVGSSNAKWCCGNANPPGPWIVGAVFDRPVIFEGFTLTSGNDVPGRDPVLFRIEGSNDADSDGNGTWTTLFDYDDGISPWDARLQVIRFSEADGDTLTNIATTYLALRLIVTDTETTATGGTVFQVNELELLGRVVPLPATAWLMLASLGALGVARRRAA